MIEVRFKVEVTWKVATHPSVLPQIRYRSGTKTYGRSDAEQPRPTVTRRCSHLSRSETQLGRCTDPHKGPL